MRFVRALLIAIFTLCSLFGGFGILIIALDWRLFGLEHKVHAAAMRIITPLLLQDGSARGVAGYPDIPYAGNPATLLGLGLVLLALLFLWAQIRCSRKAKCIAFENPGGEVDIAVSAVEDFIRRIGDDFPEVKEMEPVISGGHRGISVAAKVVLWSGGSVPDITERIQEKIRDDVQSSLGINVGSVSVVVNKMIPTGGGVEPLLEE